jgi:solute carrier family 25 ornithine transporter 2/15
MHTILYIIIGNSSLTSSISNNNNNNNRGLIALIKEIVQKEGILALWSGLKVSLTRIIPATASTFISYEYISRYLNDKAMI